MKYNASMIQYDFIRNHSLRYFYRILSHFKVKTGQTKEKRKTDKLLNQHEIAIKLHKRLCMYSKREKLLAGICWRKSL